MSCDTVLVPPSLDDTWNFVTSALSPRVAWCQVLLLHRFATPEVEWKYAWLKCCFWREGLRNIIKFLTKNIQEKCELNKVIQFHGISWHAIAWLGPRVGKGQRLASSATGRCRSADGSTRREQSLWWQSSVPYLRLEAFAVFAVLPEFCKIKFEINKQQRKNKTLEKLGELFKKSSSNICRSTHHVVCFHWSCGSCQFPRYTARKEVNHRICIQIQNALDVHDHPQGKQRDYWQLSCRLASFLPNEEKRRTVSWKQNPSCISPSWKTLLSSAQAPSRLDESEVTSVKHRSVKYFENISSRIESDSKAAESLRSRPWTHGRSAVGIVLSVPRVSCGNRVWLPSSERLGSYDIIMILLWWFYLLYIIAHHCTLFFHTRHKWSRAFQGTLPAQRLQRCRWLSLATPPPGHKLWWNMMKIRQLAKLKWWNWNDEMIIKFKKNCQIGFEGWRHTRHTPVGFDLWYSFGLKFQCLCQRAWVSRKSISCAPQRPKPDSTAWRCTSCPTDQQMFNSDSQWSHRIFENPGIDNSKGSECSLLSWIRCLDFIHFIRFRYLAWLKSSA